MMYTRERLMTAVREAGRGGRPFTLGEVRGELGLKSLDKRELKRFRSRFRECSQSFGDKLEKLGPNTFRLKAGYADPLLVQIAPAQIAPAQIAPAAPAAPTKTKSKSALRAVPPPPPRTKKQPAAALATHAGTDADTSSLLDRVGVPTRPGEEEDLYTQKRRPREQISYVAAQPGTSPRQLSFGERVSSWFGRSRHNGHDGHDGNDKSGTASTALSRLAVELQPKAASFEYRWINGKLQARTRATK